MAQRWEREDMRMPFMPFARMMRPAEELLQEFLTPCSRFKSPLSTEERIDIKLAQLSLRSNPLRDHALTDGIPLNWSALVRYLHREGVTDSERFSFPTIRTDMPKTFSVRLLPSTKTSDTDGRVNGRHGFGSGFSPEESMSRAVGELLERYTLSLYRHNNLYQASFDQIKSRRDRFDIFALNSYLPWQQETFPGFQRRADRPVMWVAGKTYPSAKKILLPAQLVFWNYRFAPDEMILAQPTTNGGAGHFTLEEALLSSLLENIQRDGFLIYWLNSLSPKVIDPSTFAEDEIKDFLKYLRRYQLEYYFLNTTTDIGVPSCTCVIIDKTTDIPTISLGGAAGFSLKELIFQSAGEALSVHTFAQASDAYRLPPTYRPFSDPAVDRHTRLGMWQGKEMLEKFRFFISGARQSYEGFIGEAMWYSTPEKRLSYITERLQALGEGYEIYFYQSQHPVLAKLGYHAVKTIVPRLMHLYLNEHMATLGAQRLKTVPEALGYKPAHTHNPYPHPFP